jgi:hypothetical protein
MVFAEYFEVDIVLIYWKLNSFVVFQIYFTIVIGKITKSNTNIVNNEYIVYMKIKRSRIHTCIQ